MKTKNDNAIENIWKTLPKTVRVGYSDFTISECSAEASTKENMDGDCDVSLSEIRIFLNRSKCEVINTIWHELIHAMVWTQGIRISEQQEEKLAINLSAAIYNLIRDNKKMMKWFIDNIK